MPDDLHTNYVLGSVIGSGGMGIVYSATQRSLGRRVAIKVPRTELMTNSFVLHRFKTEARAGSRLAHRNIARVIDFGGADGAPFLVMEYVGGIPLETIVIEHGPMTTAVAAEIVVQILAALDAAHTAGIIHADIKSANVLVEPLADGLPLAHVIDFGLAEFIDEEFVSNRILSGTPEYLAPEVVRGGRPTVASDIYAAGIVLYELLTGATPFSGGSSEQILSRHLDDVAVPPSFRAPDQSIPVAVEKVVMRSLLKDPAARFASAAEFAAALRSALPVEQVRSPRLARGTIKLEHTAEAATRDWHPLTDPLPAAPVAGHKFEIAQIRLLLADAIASSNGDSIVASYLELVHLLVDDHQLAEAVQELEHGLGLLARDALALPATWRLQLCLAGLYSGLGDPLRARTAARLGHDLAVNASSELGKQRAKELLARLSRYAGPKSPPPN